jgi:ribosomal protein S18 acetylase RimI-like enzyme
LIAFVAMASSDIPEALKLWQSSEGIALHSSDSPEALTRYLERNPGLSFVARDGAKLAGVSLAGHDGRRGYLHHVAVDAEYRHQGIGRAIVDRCLTALKEQGIEKCHLFVLGDNTDGMKFWENLGWQKRDGLILMSIALAEPES